MATAFSNYIDLESRFWLVVISGPMENNAKTAKNASNPV